MKSRRHAREVALQILYRYDVQDASKQPLPEGAALAEDLRRHFDHFRVEPELREFAAELVAGTLRSRGELDLLLERHASHWKVSRMGFIDRNLLRMAAYELRHFPEIPNAVTLNEAVELAKQFGTAESSAFVNGILDAIVKAKA